MKKFKCLLVGMAGIVFHGFATPPLKEFKINGYAQGTTYSVCYYAEGELVNKAMLDSVLQVLDQSLSLYQPHSLISDFNESTGGMPVDFHFLKVYKKAFQIYRESKGRFDATVAPLVQLWGFGPQKITQLPDRIAVNTALACVGMNKLKRQGQAILKELPCVKLDFNGIAQGYSVDVMAALLQSRKINHFMVELGGELRIRGVKNNGQLFHVGIEGPVDADLSTQRIRHVVAFKKGAITTSGNYQKYIRSGGQKRFHLIDPHTGYPLETEMVSVTVYAKDAITADGFDNALMAMTVNEALQFAGKHRLEIYMIYKRTNGELADKWSKGFQKLIVK